MNKTAPGGGNTQSAIPTTNTTHLTRGYTAALISALVLSTTAILIRVLTRDYQMPALVLACWRDFIVFIVLLAYLLLFRRRRLAVSRSDLLYLLGFGVMLAVFNSLWTLSVAFNGAAVSTVLAYSSTAFTVLLARWLLKEHLTWGRILGVVFSLAGCVLVANALDLQAWRLNLPGILTGILAGLWYAIYTLMGRAASTRGIDPWTTLLYTFAVAAVCLLIFNLGGGGILPGAAVTPANLLWLGKDWLAWGVLILLAAGPTLAGFGFYNVALSHLPSGVVNLIATSEPVFTAAIAYLLLGERLNWLQIAGSALILGTVVALRLSEGKLTGQPGR